MNPTQSGLSPHRTETGEFGPLPRIAILRGGGFGDFISITPALRTLHRTMPGSEITLITNSRLARFAARYPEIDRIAVAPPYEGVIQGEPDDAASAAFFWEMRQQHFDLALQWHGGGRHSNGFVRKLGAEVTAGFKTEDALPLDYWLPYDYWQHEQFRYMDLLRLLGIHTSDYHVHLPLLPSDMEALVAHATLFDLETLRNGLYLGIHASSGSPNRRWPPERFARVADSLLEESDYQGVLITAGPGEEEHSAAVLAGMARRERAVDLGGKLSLDALIGLISKLGMLVGNDSGPVHIATALGTPTVVVFGAANPANWAPLDRTYHRIAVNWGAPCRTATGDSCANESDIECLLGVQPSDVLAEARDLLRITGRQNRAAARRAA